VSRVELVENLNVILVEQRVVGLAPAHYVILYGVCHVCHHGGHGPMILVIDARVSVPFVTIMLAAPKLSATIHHTNLQFVLTMIAYVPSIVIGATIKPFQLLLSLQRLYLQYQIPLFQRAIKFMLASKCDASYMTDSAKVLYNSLAINTNIMMNEFKSMYGRTKRKTLEDGTPTFSMV
jgi:hypothetical protein